MQIYWLPLRLYTIPLQDQQIAKIQEQFNYLRNEVKDGDILAVDKLAQYKQSIQNRIQQIDQFYRKNCLDPRIKYIYGGRTQLARIISMEVPQIENAKESCWKMPWLEQQHNSHPQISSRIIQSRKNEHQEYFTSNKYAKQQLNENKKQNKVNFQQSNYQNKKIQTPHLNKYMLNTNQNLKKVNTNNHNNKIRTPIKTQQQQQVLQRNRTPSTRWKKNKVENYQPNITPNKVIKNNHSITPTKIYNAKNLNSKKNKNNITKKSFSHIVYGHEKQEKINQVLKESKKLEKPIKKQVIQIKKTQKNDNLQSLSDLIFTIKMTQEQYRNLIKIKQSIPNNDIHLKK